MSSSPAQDQFAADVAAVRRIAAVPSILKVLCQMTGMGFAAVARVTDSGWTACAVEDRINFGLKPGGQLEVHTTLCKEVRQAGGAIVIDHASEDPTYCLHPTPAMYGFESYVSVPIVLSGGGYFGNLCAIDPRPAQVSDPKTVLAFQHFAQLIAFELDSQRILDAAQDELRDEKADGLLREQFIAMLGHDLRNPLGSISASAAILKLKTSEPLTLNLAERIGTNAGRMTRLINDLLDLARGRLAGGLQVHPTAIEDLPAAIEEVIEELRGAHPDRTLVTEIEIDRPVWGSRDRIQQLVSNLVANAVVHGSPSAPVGVTVATGSGQLEIGVHNEGEPISPDMLKNIFAPFARKAPNGRGEGLGLGLYICEQIVNAHGGSLEARSTKDKGTTFIAKLPLQAG